MYILYNRINTTIAHRSGLLLLVLLCIEYFVSSSKLVPEKMMFREHWCCEFSIISGLICCVSDVIRILWVLFWPYYNLTLVSVVITEILPIPIFVSCWRCFKRGIILIAYANIHLIPYRTFTRIYEYEHSSANITRNVRFCSIISL